MKFYFKLDVSGETSISKEDIKSWKINDSEQTIEEYPELNSFFKSENLNLNVDLTGNWSIDVDSTKVSDLKNIELILIYEGKID